MFTDYEAKNRNASHSVVDCLITKQTRSTSTKMPCSSCMSISLQSSRASPTSHHKELLTFGALEALYLVQCPYTSPDKAHDLLLETSLRLTPAWQGCRGWDSGCHIRVVDSITCSYWTCQHYANYFHISWQSLGNTVNPPPLALLEVKFLTDESKYCVN